MKFNNKTIIYLILIGAIILRSVNYFDIPFTHDEFSALFRLKFDNFFELIEKGVKIDGHPAGVQVFLYYWTKLFGFQEWVMKLPFTIFGILSVYIIYLIGKKWFNETVGLISAAYLASIQFTVMYSQIARPYISGMFFSLLMIYYWSNIMMSPNKNFKINCFLFIISTTLCAYNHHFSLLFAAIVCISGVFYINRKYLIKYLICGLVIFILYIPHLNIFFYQLSIGGVESWLAKPHNDFIFQFIYYIFNYSIVSVASVLGIIFLGLNQLKKDAFNIKLIVLSFLWFMIPFFIGFIYSKYVNAVLQYSVLIFSFPLLFFVLFGFLKNQSVKVNFILVLMIILINSLTLVYGRKHYDLFYKSVYKQVLIDYENVKKMNSNTIYIIDSHDKISEYYVSQLDIDTNYINYSKSFQNLIEFKSFLETEAKTHNKLYFGCLSSVSPIIIPLIQDYFPHIEIQNNYYGGSTYLFSKRNDGTNNIINNLSFDLDDLGGWTSVDLGKIIIVNDTSKDNGYLMSRNVEWGPLFKIALKDIMENKNNFIDISVKVKNIEALDEVILVGSLESKGKSLYWGGTDFKEFVLPNQNKHDWFIAHHSIKLSDIYLKYDDIYLNIYIWNKGGKSFIIDDFKISVREGNPVIYGLNEKI